MAIHLLNFSLLMAGNGLYLAKGSFHTEVLMKTIKFTMVLLHRFTPTPAVKSESAATGNTGTNEGNNFRQLLAAAPIVAAYNGFVELAVGISGPSTVNVGQQYTFTANVQNCPGTTYRWERSENGVNYFTVGTARTTTSTAIPVSGNRVYYRLRVTCTDGRIRTVTRSVFIQGGPGGPILLQARIQTDSLADYTEELSEALVLFPNPAQGQVNLITDFQGKEQVTVMIYGITLMGYEKRLFKGRLENGQGQLILDVSNVPQGLYQLVVIAGGGSFIIYFYRHCLLITAQA